MHNRISYYILSLLYHEGRVRIPGVGKIVRKERPAELSETEAVIRPPHADTKFSESKNGKYRLLEKLVAYKTNSSRTRARREIALFGRDLKDGIKKEGSVELKYLGTFSRLGDSIYFSPNEQYVNPSYAGNIPLPPHIASKEETEAIPYATRDISLPVSSDVQSKKGFQPPPEEIAPEETSQPTESIKSDVVEEVIAPVVVLPVGKEDAEGMEEVEEIAEWGEKEEKEEKEIAPSVILPFEKKEPEPPVIIAPIAPSRPQPVESVSSAKPQPVPVKPVTRKKPAPPPPPEEDRVNILFPILGLLVLGLLVGAFLFYQARVSKDETALVTDTTSQDMVPVQPEAPVEDANTGALTTDSLAAATEDETKIALADTGSNNEEPSEPTSTTSPPVEHVAETPPSPPAEPSRHAATGECIIVVGSFSMSSNTDRMVSRLNDLGYTTLTNPNGSLTQVGVPVDCKAKNLNVVLSFLRSNVEKEAWVKR